MARGFLYFLPGRQAITPEEIERVTGGLMPAHGHKRTSGPGPDGNGVMFARPGVALHYDAEGQTWEQHGELWIGLSNDARPGPADLLRPDAIRGHMVELNDGQAWEIPILRVLDPGIILPQFQQFFLAADGERRMEMRPEYVDLGRRVEQVWERLMEAAMAGRASFDIVTDGDMIEEAIGLNYFMGQGEISLSRLLNMGNVSAVINAMLDVPSISAFMKKKILADA